MRRVSLAVALAFIATACVAQSGLAGPASSGQNTTAVAMQEPGGTQAGIAASAGEKTIVGCVGIGAPRGFVINTADGRAITLFTDRDLSQFVGKQVEIKTKWRRRGMAMQEPAASPSSTTSTSGEASATTSKAAPETQEFAGSMSMTFTGKVMGPCPMKK